MATGELKMVNKRLPVLKSDDNKVSVQSLQRAFSIIEGFSFEKPQLTIKEISILVELPRSTVTRLVSSLTKMGYLFRDKDTLKYSLGLKLCLLGNIAGKSRELKEIAEPIMRKMRDKYGETVYLDIRGGFERLCILSFDGNQTIRMIVPVGHRTPLYAGSDGRILLSFQPDEVIDDYFKTCNLERKTPNTITDPNNLWDEIYKSRKNGYAISYGEWCEASVGISAPIYNYMGVVIAALSMSVPTYRVNRKELKIYLSAILQASRNISTLLGFIAVEK